MVRDLSDPYDARRRQATHVRRLMASTAIQNTAVDRGALRVKSAEGLHVGTVEDQTGSQIVYGILRIVGRLIGEGRVEWTGPWIFSGDGEITGDVVAEGRWTQNGPWEFNGPGDIAGDVELTGNLEVLGGGRIKVGNVVITPGSGGRITIGTGASQIIIDPSQLKVGPAFRMDPAHSDDGAQMEFGTSGKTTLYGDDESFQIVNTNGQNPHNFTVDGLGYSLMNVLPLPQGESASYLVIGGDGRLYTSVGMGGGGGTPEPGQDLGNFQWPFALSTVTSEYGPRWGRMHEGIDFGNPPAVAGAPIIAAGDGTIAVNTFSAGWGNYVRITHTVGGQQLSTLYAHMNAPGLPPVGSAVKKGDVIGYVGNTGNSFGAHLHFETWMGTSYGTHTNPRDFMAAFGPE